jgi:dihydroneopterin aldolase
MPIASAAQGIRHVFLHGLILPARIGVFAAEEGRTQRVRISVDLGVADTPGGDELARVVDYSAIVARVRAIVAAGHVRLVETLAERIAESCLADARIFSARIRVEKLDIYPDAEGVGVEIERRRP